MKFSIMSRANIRKYFYHTLDHDCVVISITDVDSDPVDLPQNEHIKAILRLSFEDSDEETPTSISSRDADKITEFISRFRNTVAEIIIHCEAGISRSAGVCAALMLWLNGSDKPVFDNAYYRPNMRCYRFVLNSVESMNIGRIDKTYEWSKTKEMAFH